MQQNYGGIKVNIFLNMLLLVVGLQVVGGIDVGVPV